MLDRLALVRPDERRGVAAAALTIFGALAAHTLLETARDALFLASQPASRLALVYLVIAAAGVALARLRGRLARGPFALSALLGAGAFVTLVLWLLGRFESPLELYVLYVWTGLLGSVIVLQFWMVLGDLFTLTQAKRLYSVVWTGSLLGASAGAAAARLVAQRAPVSVLVLLAAAALALTAVGPALALGRAVRGAAREEPAGTSLREGLRLMQRHGYLRSLAVLVLLSTTALTLGDYVFKSAVARAVPAAQLGSFFGGVYALLTLLALLAQVLLGGWLFRSVGVHRALWLLPGLLFMGAAGVALGGGLVAALLLKGSDGALRNSVHRTGGELLYLPLPDVLRVRAKPFIDIVGQRGGQALASLLILSETLLARGDVVLAAAAAAVSLVWIAWVSEMKEPYLDLFRAALRGGTLRPAADLPPVDLVSLETLFAGLNSADDHEVLAAMDLLHGEGRTRLVPALILYHPSQRVVLHALALFAKAGRTDFLGIAERLLQHSDPEIRGAALRARTRAQPAEQPLRAALADESPIVRATALVLLAREGWAGRDQQQALERLLQQDGDGRAALALAQAMAEQPSPAFEDLLLRLSESSSDRLLVQVASAMGQVRSPRFLPALLLMLGRREVRGEARSALLAYDGEALGFLERALADRALPVELRRHLPRTISLFPPAAAALVIERHLLEEPSGVVRYRMLRAMNRLAASPEARFDVARLRRGVAGTCEAAFRLIHWRLTLEQGRAQDARRATPGWELLVSLLRDKEAQSLERLFRLLALVFRGEDFEGIYRGLRSADARRRASSRELLEHLLDAPLRGPLLALVDDADDASRLARSGAVYTPDASSYEAALEQMLVSGGESLRCIVAFHVGELGLVRFRARLHDLAARSSSFFLARVAERSLERLATAGGGAHG